MRPASTEYPESSSTPDAPRPRLYTPGLSDALGDRLLTFDNSTASSLELLKFKKVFSDAPGFESALRSRVEECTRFRHPSIAPVRGVEWVGAHEDLALVSIHTAGRRLSEILRDARGAAFATELVRQIAPALAAFHQAGQGFAHGALTPDRIVVTREGRLVIVEHVLAGALESLHWSAGRVRTDLGLPVAADADPVKFDPRLDVIQLALVALSLLLGRRIEPTEYPANATALLDEFTHGDAASSARLRPWLERALQMGARPLETAQGAFDAFGELADGEDAPATSVATPPVVAKPVAAKPASIDQRPLTTLSTTATSTPARGIERIQPEADADLAPAAAGPTQWRSGRAMKIVRWAVAALAVLAVGEGLVIAGLFSRPGAVVIAPPPPRTDILGTQTALAVPTPVATPAATPEAPAPTPAASTTTQAAASVDKSAPAPADGNSVAKPTSTAASATTSGSKFGGIKLSCPVDLQVFEANALIGSTASPLAVNEGPHTLDLVNDTLGFHSRQTVTVRAGQMTNLTVPVPDGRVSINAVPWADVVIDGTPAGQTPIANFALRIGSHEIVFRHPQLGEQKQTVTVKADGLTRVSAVLQK